MKLIDHGLVAVKQVARCYFLVSKADWTAFNGFRRLFEHLRGDFGSMQILQHNWTSFDSPSSQRRMLSAQCVVIAVSKQTHRSKTVAAALELANAHNKYVLVVTAQDIPAFSAANDAAGDGKASPLEEFLCKLPHRPLWLPLGHDNDPAAYAAIKSATLRDDARTRQHTRTLLDALAWEDSKRSTYRLLPPDRLDEDEDVMDAPFPEASPLMREYFNESQKYISEAVRRRRRRSFTFSFLIAFLSVASVVGCGVAIWAAIDAQQKTASLRFVTPADAAASQRRATNHPNGSCSSQSRAKSSADGYPHPHVRMLTHQTDVEKLFSANEPELAVLAASEQRSLQSFASSLASAYESAPQEPIIVASAAVWATMMRAYGQFHSNFPSISFRTLPFNRQGVTYPSAGASRDAAVLFGDTHVAVVSQRGVMFFWTVADSGAAVGPFSPTDATANANITAILAGNDVLLAHVVITAHADGVVRLWRVLQGAATLLQTIALPGGSALVGLTMASVNPLVVAWQDRAYFIMRVDSSANSVSVSRILTASATDGAILDFSLSTTGLYAAILTSDGQTTTLQIVAMPFGANSTAIRVLASVATNCSACNAARCGFDAVVDWISDSSILLNGAALCQVQVNFTSNVITVWPPASASFFPSAFADVLSRRLYLVRNVERNIFQSVRYGFNATGFMYLYDPQILRPSTQLVAPLHTAAAITAGRSKSLLAVETLEMSTTPPTPELRLYRLARLSAEERNNLTCGARVSAVAASDVTSFDVCGSGRYIVGADASGDLKLLDLEAKSNLTYVESKVLFNVSNVC